VQTLRRAHYVDIENLCGLGLPEHEQILLAMARFERAIGSITGERLTVACNHKVAPTVGFTLGLSGAQLQRGSGPDGADHALLEILLDDLNHERVSSVVVGSGDGCFADALAPYREQLEELVFVAPTGSLSHRSLELGDRCYLLPAPVLRLAS